MNVSLITTIIPTYRRPQLLKRAIRSVLCQSFPQFTLLVADNASGDATIDVIQEFMLQDARVKMIQQSENIGMTANFRSAFEEVTTPYVSFLPDDDFLSPSFFEKALNGFKSYPDCAFCGGGGLIIDQEYRVRGIESLSQQIPATGYYAPPDGYLTYLKTSFGIAFPPLLFKTDVVREVGGFDPRIQIGVDEDLVSKCAAQFPIYLQTDEPFYFGYQHAHSLSKQTNFPTYERDCQCLYENIRALSLPNEIAVEIDVFFQKRLIKIWSNAFRHFCHEKQYDEARSYADKLCSYTGLPEWERKRRQVMRYARFSFFETFYQKLKTSEQIFRRAIGKKKKERIVKPTLHPDADYWKEYTLKLERGEEHEPSQKTLT